MPLEDTDDREELDPEVLAIMNSVQPYRNTQVKVKGLPEPTIYPTDPLPLDPFSDHPNTFCKLEKLRTYGATLVYNNKKSDNMEPMLSKIRQT